MKGYIVDIKEENVDLGFNVNFKSRYIWLQAYSFEKHV